MTPPVKEIFDRIAPFYDRVNRLMTLSRIGAMRGRLVSELAFRLNLNALDLCAGTLECSRAVLKRFPCARVTAVDVSGAMLDVGLSKFDANGLSRMSVIRGDALDVELPAGSFDAVLCAWGIRNIDAREALLRRVRSWLKPGGQFIALDLFRPAGALRRALLHTVGAFTIPLLGMICAGDCSAYRYLVRSIGEMPPPSEFEAMLLRNGFASVRCERLFFGTHHLFIAE